MGYQETECTKLSLIILLGNKFIFSIILPHFELLESVSHSYLARLFTLCLGCHSCTVSMAFNAPTGSADNNSMALLVYYITYHNYPPIIISQLQRTYFSLLSFSTLMCQIQSASKFAGTRYLVGRHHNFQH